MLSYKDQRELGNLPAKIEKLESQQSQLEEQMSAPGFYQSDYEKVQLVSQKLAEVQGQLEAAFERWSELETK
jgi:ATP-binding cassette subfamily F protein uup